MAVSTIAAYEGGSGIQIPCILYEGGITVNTGVMGSDGYTDSTYTFAAPLKKDDIVVLDVQTNNTFDATRGLPVVKPIAAGTYIVGKILTEPTPPEALPANTAAADTWAEILAGKFYRKATVWFPGIVSTAKAVLTTTDTAAILPGDPALVKVDASASVALSGGVCTLAVVDVASGGAGVISFHYAAKASAASYSLLVGFTGGPVVIQA